MAERTGLNPNFSLRDYMEQSPTPQNQEKPDVSIAADQLERLIYEDTLTHFGNRRGLNQLKGSLTDKDYPLTIVSIDLDNLKKINDDPDPEKGGHAGGDRYILSFVKFINESFPSIQKFRLGGDEFTFPFSGNQSELETIYSKLEDFNNREQNPNKLEFTYAIDIATSDKDFYPALERSDYKLVEAKKEKKAQQNLPNQASVSEKQQPQ